MSRRRNQKRRKARKDRAEAKANEAKAKVQAVRGKANRRFLGKVRRGDAAELDLTFSESFLASYDEEGELKL